MWGLTGYKEAMVLREFEGGGRGGIYGGEEEIRLVRRHGGRGCWSGWAGVEASN